MHLANQNKEKDAVCQTPGPVKLMLSEWSGPNFFTNANALCALKLQ